MKNTSPIVKSFFVTLIGSGASKVVMILCTFYCTNILTKTDFGEFSFVRNTLNTILCICGLNFANLSTKFATELSKTNNARHKLIILFTFSIITCLLFGACLFFTPKEIMLKVFETETVTDSFKLVGILLPIFIVQPLSEGVLKGLLKFKEIGWIQTISSIFFFVAVAVGIKINGLNGALLGMIIYYALYGIAGFGLMIHFLDMSMLKISLKDLKKETSVLNKMIVPIFIMSFIEAPVFWAAQYILSKYGSYSSVGSMSAITQLRNLIILIPTYFFGTFFAYAGQMNAEKNYAAYFSKFSKLIRYSIIVSIVAIVGIVVFGKYALELYGRDYVVDFMSLNIAALGIPGLILAPLLRCDIILQEHQQWLLTVSIIWNAIFLVCIFILIKWISSLNAFFISQLAGIVVMISLYIIRYRKDKYVLYGK